jgi:hypothetical protein
MDISATNLLVESAGLPPAQWLPKLLRLQADRALEEAVERLRELRILRALRSRERAWRQNHEYTENEREALAIMDYPRDEVAFKPAHWGLVELVETTAVRLGVAVPFCSCAFCDEKFERSFADATRRATGPWRRLRYASRVLCRNVAGPSK